MDTNYGKIAYGAYCNATGGRSLISGAELPTWDKLDARIQNAWVEAALAVQLTVIMEQAAVEPQVTDMTVGFPMDSSHGMDVIRIDESTLPLPTGGDWMYYDRVDGRFMDERT